MNYYKIQFISIIILGLLTGCAAGAAEGSSPSPSPSLLPLPTLALTLPAPVSDTPPTPSPTRVAPEPSPSPVLPTLEATATPLPAATTNAAECPCEINHVVIISIDGLRPDAIEQADTPTLDALRVQGAYSPAAKTVLPSVTLVSHASMLGGMTPEKHGIFWNVDDPELGQIKGPTLFSVAHEAGFSTGMVVGKPKLEHLVLPDSVDTYIYAGFTDRQVANQALNVIQTDMPAVLFIHLPDVDSAGHALGWMSLAQLLALNLTDGIISEIVAELQTQGYLDQTLLIITADHGGSEKKHGSDSPEDMTIPWLAVGPGVPAGVILQREIITYDTAATALYALGVTIPSAWDGQPVLEIFAGISQTK